MARSPGRSVPNAWGSQNETSIGPRIRNSISDRMRGRNRRKQGSLAVSLLMRDRASSRPSPSWRRFPRIRSHATIDAERRPRCCVTTPQGSAPSWHARSSAQSCPNVRTSRAGRGTSSSRRHGGLRAVATGDRGCAACRPAGVRRRRAPGRAFVHLRRRAAVFRARRDGGHARSRPPPAHGAGFAGRRVPCAVSLESHECERSPCGDRALVVTL
jgi:hypothetical protein